MWCLYLFVVSVLVTTSAGPVTENYKDQFCTDPRTMQKHAAYTEWADAYSCTRHRCQPGGRNLAIYTVGCKRVEAPESAIECEEVVEDTNMQFPFCCTRLRCLVVVRGEVWTRVLGQPWETLPAAPWSHMYKKKKPPPPNGMLLNKNAGTGPIYELAPDAEASPQKVLRASKKTTGPPDADCNDAKPIQVPDIVIALATEPETKEQKKSDNRHKRRKTSHATSDETDKQLRNNEVEFEDAVIITDRAPEASEEKINSVTRKASNSKNHAAWTEIPQKEWNEQDPSTDTENTFKETPRASAEKQPALQALVDAIGSRMRDIEDVVQRMSQKVSQGKPGEDSAEKRRVYRSSAPDHLSDAEVVPPRSHHKSQQPDHFAVMKPKQPSPDNEHYKRFTVLNRGSKYLRTTDGPASEPPLFVEDAHLNGYFSDASNSVQRRVNPPKEPAQYVAPVDTHHKTHILSDGSDETRKHSRRAHKKKGKGHKKHHGKDKRKKIRVISTESDRNTVSLEDNSAIVNL